MAQATFEVAAIKPSNAGADHSGIITDKGRIRAENVTLRRCIRGAWSLPETQIQGGPKWLDDARWDITAKAERPADDPELMIMLQALLAERFKLAVHIESKMTAGYALVPARGGMKAKPSAPDSRSSTNYISTAMGKSIDAVACNMGSLAQKLSDALHIPVADFTDSKGDFDFHLEWWPEDTRGPDATDANAANARPSIFSALQEQLGLKLEARKIPASVLVIDHAELPTEN